VCTTSVTTIAGHATRTVALEARRSFLDQAGIDLAGGAAADPLRRAAEA
jgi:hypothetical protein